MKNDAIVMVGFAGSFGAGLVAQKKSRELKERFPSFLIRNAVSEGQKSYPEKTIALLKEWEDDFEIVGIHPVSEGGVFKGLWNLGEECGVGFSVDLKEIPVKQECVEICNFFDINPYQLYSEGVLLILARDGDGLADKLRKNGVPAVVIGRTHPEKKRVIVNEDEERFLEPRKGDSLVEIN